ncbi:hypothetical protein [Vagococcus fluvialis]|uniref:hypothetical protein n=1 Tax=Vagococcus fluvialis TaxID=2738 RepID=UPI0028F6FBE3|nr:hypothetical protein [Vagococcus fluvialis]WNF91619.1 hypothetical protein QDW48_13865 [Vagococcus fluvialis]
MARRNVYMTDETTTQVEKYMEENNLTTHTEAVRNIVAEHHEEKLKQETELSTKLKSIDKNVEVLTHLMIFMAESMSATKHDKRFSTLYEEALEAREREIKRHVSGSELMFNE